MLLEATIAAVDNVEYRMIEESRISASTCDPLPQPALDIPALGTSPPVPKKAASVRFKLNQPPKIELDEEGNECIIVPKTKPFLGLAVEGGADTHQPLPRIINIQGTGAAFEAGGLRVGHVIISVDGHPLAGLGHKAAAETIANAYANPKRKEIFFAVTEIKKTPHELRRSSLAFLYDD